MHPTPPTLLLRGLDPLIALALREDVGRGDVTSRALVPPDRVARAVIRAKSDFILAGWPAAKKVLAKVDADIRVLEAQPEGARLRAGETVARLRGRARSLLAAERVALNFLQQLSGIATLTDRFVRAVTGTRARISATRKTHPGLQRLEKYAVTVGGGVPHRLGLDDGILIKDNHLALCGSVSEAVARARRVAGRSRAVEIEVETLGQLDEALAAGADVILLDNMKLAMLRRAVEKNQGRALLEASGGITLANVAAVARTGVDFISVGALTHSAPAADISLDLEPDDGG